MVDITSVGSNTLTANGDWVGRLSFMGNDSAEFVELARVAGFVDGTSGSNDMPGRLVFSTTADGASSPTERLRIDRSGNVGIGTSSPTGYIHIEGVSTGTETYGRFTTGPANGDQSLVIKSGSSRDHMAIQVSTNAGANDDLALQPDGGNVGIGTSSPTKHLQIGSFGGNDSNIQLAASTTGASNILFGDASDGDNWFKGFIKYAHSSDSLELYSSSVLKASTRKRAPTHRQLWAVVGWDRHFS